MRLLAPVSAHSYGSFSRFHRREKLVPSFDVSTWHFLGARVWAGRGFAEIDRWVAVRIPGGNRIVALLMEYLAVSERRVSSQLNLSPFIPPSDSHSSTIFWNSMGPPPYSPPTNPGPLSS